MKIFAFVVIAFAAVCAVNAKTYREQFNTIVDQCLAEQKLTKDDLAVFKNPDAQVNKNLQCFAKCFLGTYGFLVDGVIHVDEATKLLGPVLGEDQLKSTIANCNSLKGADECETAYKVFACYNKNNPTKLP